MQSRQRVLQNVGGVIVEPVPHVDVADTRTKEVVIGSGRLAHSRANDVDRFDLATSGASHRYFDVTVARAANLVAHFGRQLSMHRNAVNGIDAVAVAQTAAPRGRMIKS